MLINTQGDAIMGLCSYLLVHMSICRLFGPSNWKVKGNTKHMKYFQGSLKWTLDHMLPAFIIRLLLIALVYIYAPAMMNWLWERKSRISSIKLFLCFILLFYILQGIHQLVISHDEGGGNRASAFFKQNRKK